MVAECGAGVKVAGWHDFCSGRMHAIDVMAQDRRGVVRGAVRGLVVSEDLDYLGYA